MQLYRFDCPDKFAAESTDKEELKMIAKMHVKEKDHMDLSDKEFEEAIKELN